MAALHCSGAAQAGVYSTAEPKFKLYDNDYPKFLDETLIPLKRIGTPGVYQENLDWLRCYSLAGKTLRQFELLRTPGLDEMTDEDWLNLSACYLRVRNPQGAIKLLLEAEKLGYLRKNFLLASNLGTAYMLAGVYTGDDNAVRRLGDAWPWRQSFADFSEEQQKFLQKQMGWAEDHPFPWYTRCEKYLYRLAKLRAWEVRTSKGKLDFRSDLRVLRYLDDFLVPDPDLPMDYQAVQFVSRRQPFELGKFPASEKARLPKDAIAVVQQLLVWMPEDLRLIWLLGELLNADGTPYDIKSAQIIFSEFRSRFAGLPKNAALAKDEKALMERFTEEHPIIATRLKALKEYVPPLPDAPGGEATGAKKSPTDVAGTKTPTAPAPTVGAVNVDWQTLGVGFGAGALVGILVTWQLRDILRRRQTRAAALTATPVGGGWQPPNNSGKATPEQR
jgi:hypothetical protein